MKRYSKAKINIYRNFFFGPQAPLGLCILRLRKNQKPLIWPTVYCAIFSINYFFLNFNLLWNGTHMECLPTFFVENHTGQ